MPARRLTVGAQAVKVRSFKSCPALAPASMAAASIPTLSAHGAEIPAIGFGTSSLGNCGEIVATALELGYRHIDTAWKYGTERGVGDGIRAARAARRDFPDHQGVA
jgi:hypothetical protein